MAFEVELNGTGDQEGRYFTFAPSPARVRQTPSAADQTITISSSRNTPSGGELVFFSTHASASEETVDLDLPASGNWVDFWVAGKWESPSTDDHDCELVVASGAEQEKVPVMVRIRKNANTLGDGERDRFLNAFKLLNNGGAGAFQDFRDMHVNPADGEEHRGTQFLAWHRAYLLDIERQLQIIDASVALHYWRFDQPAPNVLSADFMGGTDQVTEGSPGRPVRFAPGHPLAGWITDSTPGINRSAFFDTQTQSAPGLTVLNNFPLIDQASTLALGSVYNNFRAMEGSPHGAAHVSFGGWMSSINTAAKDPLFFMLHSNIDRLWALWQWTNNRMDMNNIDSYVPQNRDGRKVGDTLWPWNNIQTPPRPPFAPRDAIGLTPTKSAAAPGPTPTVGSMIDSQGTLAAHFRIGSGYDDVPFESPGANNP